MPFNKATTTINEKGHQKRQRYVSDIKRPLFHRDLTKQFTFPCKLASINVIVLKHSWCVKRVCVYEYRALACETQRLDLG